jgi:hypothetical protein
MFCKGPKSVKASVLPSFFFATFAKKKEGKTARIYILGNPLTETDGSLPNER